MTNRAGSAAAAAKEAHTVISTIGRWVGEIAHEHVTVPVPNGAWRAGARNRLRALATARALAATFAATSAATAGALAARLLRSRRRRRRSERRRRGCSVGDESRDKLLASPIGNLLGESGEGLTCGSDGVEHSRYVAENGVHERAKMVVHQISAAAGLDGSIDLYLEITSPADECKHSIECMLLVPGKERLHELLETLQNSDKVVKGEAGAFDGVAVAHEGLNSRKSGRVDESKGRVTEVRQRARV